MLVNQRQLFDPMGLQNLLGVFQVDPQLGGDDLGSHHFAHRIVQPLYEAQVAIGKNPHQVIVMHHRETRDPVTPHQVERLADFLLGIDRDRIGDHAAFVFLDYFDFGRLIFHRQVTMDEAEAAQLRARDRGRGLGDGIHRTCDQRYVEPDAPAQHGGHVALMGQHVGFLREQKHIVKG